MSDASPLLRGPHPSRGVAALAIGAVLLAGVFWGLREIPWEPALHELVRNGAMATLRAHQADLATALAALGWRAPALFALIYVTLAGLTLPINIPMSAAAGAMFGLWPGVALAALCTSIGASLSCLSSRTFLRGWVMRRLHGQLAEIEAGLEADGVLYLLTLRLMPLVPYTMVNLLFGLTTMKLPRFFAITLLGTLPATIAFVNAGTELQQLGDGGAILGLRLGISLTLLGCVPVCVARINRWRRR